MSTKTIVKCAQCLTQAIFRDKIAKIKEIRQNIHESIYELVSHMQKLEIPFDSLQNRKSGEWITDFGKKSPQNFNDVSDGYY